jgi:Ca2+-binding RTX toxin-like protein
MNPLRWILLTAFIAPLVLSATASAATVSRQGDQIRYEAAPGERNGVLVSQGSNADEIGFTENSPAHLEPGPGCARSLDPTDPTKFVTCPKAGITVVTVDLRSDDDDASVLFGGSSPQPAPVVINGGPGRDWVVSYGTVTLDGVANDGPQGTDNYVDVEDVWNASAGVNDNFTGNDGANRLESPGGTDVFGGRGGDDVIVARDVQRDLEDSGQVAPDRVTCGAGNDAAYVDDVDVVADDCEVVIRRDNVARLTADDDHFAAARPGLTIFGLGGDDDIAAGGAQSVSGGSGNDRIKLGSALDITANGDSGNDRIYGLVGRDHINGGAGNDKLYGERSNDRIDGGPGRDGIDAGQGDDVIRVRDGAVDRVHCSSGRDVVVADRKDKVSRDCERVSRR